MEEADARQSELEAHGGVVPLPWVDVYDPVEDIAERAVDDWTVGGRAAGRWWRATNAVRAWTARRHRRGDRRLRRREIMLRQMLGYAEDLIRPSQAHGEPMPTVFSVHSVSTHPEPTPRKGRAKASTDGLERRAVPEGTTIDELFTECADTLVLLGDAGLGKTTQVGHLLHALAEDGLRQVREPGAAAGPLPPIPIPVSLATYRGEPLAEWLAATINRTHDIATKQVKTWLAEDALLVLFDGLDEVPEPHRAACAKQLHAFRERSVGIVVTCRDRDLRLARAIGTRQLVVIERPTRAHVQHHLAQQGESLAAVRAALEGDASLWDLLRSPLMLSIVHATYAGRDTAPELTEKGTPQERTQRVLDAYVHR